METTRPSGPPQVLVIDDSEVVRTIIKVSLGRIGYEVTAYADPLEALQALAGGEVPRIAVAIVDLGLPRLDGYDVIRLVRADARFQHLPIIVVSARDGVLARMKARLVGANEFLTKPFKEQALRALVRKHAPLPPRRP